MKNAVVWDMMTPCGSCKNRSFGGIYRLHLQEEKLSQSFCSEDVPYD
jgi:hypothetical protein